MNPNAANAQNNFWKSARGFAVLPFLFFLAFAVSLPASAQENTEADDASTTTIIEEEDFKKGDPEIIPEITPEPDEPEIVAPEPEPEPKPPEAKPEPAPESEEATTTGAAASTITGNMNQPPASSSAGNYYPPLDALSPSMTYSLGGLAMIFGIIGAVLIVRDPRERQNIAWPIGLANRDEPALPGQHSSLQEL